MMRRDVLELDAGAEAGAGAGATPQVRAGRAGGAQAGTVAGWNDVALEAVRILRPQARTAAQALAALHTGMYNAWAAYERDARQSTPGVAVRLPRAERNGAGKAAAMSHAAWTMLAALFPAQRPVLDMHMASLGLDPAAPACQLSPAGIGRAQAAAMLDAWHAGMGPFAPAVLAIGRRTAPDRTACMAAPLHCWAWARGLAAREGGGDDRDVLLYFALGNALADAALAAQAAAVDAARACDAAAAEVLRRFGGGAGRRIAPCALGKRVGALVFERARRHWT
ncbi:DUF6851 domain-containing protein [uncultured Massilia sp.]|uniref:DUF6851 domain-containing protein n=1 Tax=uncultured Massilia sp. TaxID=169973 RepID=UPI0025E4393D|nr:hypothetical protein [uncultured Massilia sp.]